MTSIFNKKTYGADQLDTGLLNDFIDVIKTSIIARCGHKM